MLTDHGGVAAMAILSVQLTQSDLGVKPSSFECLCIRIEPGSSACIVLIVYRPGSEAISSTFWSDMSDVFDRLVTYVVSVFVVGDMNVHLEDPIAASRFNDLLDGYGFASRILTQHTVLVLSSIPLLHALTYHRQSLMFSMLVCLITVSFDGYQLWQSISMP